MQDKLTGPDICENIMRGRIECLDSGPFVVTHVRCWDKASESTEVLDTKFAMDNVDLGVESGICIKSHLSNEVHGISTGLGFLDHMVDQLNSHAQVSVSISIGLKDVYAAEDDSRNRFADMDQSALMHLVGTAIGEQIRELLPPVNSTSRFCCPLDEALVECVLETTTDESQSTKITYDISPYGSFPKTTGRTIIGQMKTEPLEQFWKSLAESMRLKSLFMKKHRGHNGHHVVESSFKAFSRALRCLIDGTTEEDLDYMWGRKSQGFAQGLSLQRAAFVSRATKETSIHVEMSLDGGEAGTDIQTGVQFLDQIYSVIVEECECMSLRVKCSGDLWVDDHHTVS